MRLHSPSPEATRATARLLAACLDAGGLVISLEGPLGAGKTLFVQGLAEGLGLEPGAVSSPTFVIATEHRTPAGRPFAHVDAYRLGSAAELEAAGFVDLLLPGAIVAVEWGDRVPDALPADRLEVAIARADEPGEGRELRVTARGQAAAAVATRWRERLAAQAPGCGAARLADGG